MATGTQQMPCSGPGAATAHGELFRSDWRAGGGGGGGGNGASGGSDFLSEQHKLLAGLNYVSKFKHTFSGGEEYESDLVKGCKVVGDDEIAWLSSREGSPCASWLRGLLSFRQRRRQCSRTAPEVWAMLAPACAHRAGRTTAV